METLKIRPVNRSDAAVVDELLDQLGYPPAGGDVTATRIQAWSDDQSSAALAAEAGGELVGVIAVHVCPFFEHDGSWARIVALVVAEQARGGGVGSRLVVAAESFAAARGCRRLEVTSRDGRHDAHEFYRRCGFVDQSGRSSRFLRELPAPTTTVRSRT